MTRLEWRWCLKYSVLLGALTTLPYLVATFKQGEAWAFTGSVIAVEDGNSYIAKMRLGASGDWLFRTPYTSRPPQGLPAFLPYLLLGKLAGTQPSHAALLVLYHALRLTAIPLAVAATYRFHALWVASEAWRRWGTLLATLGGGLGWVLLLIGQPGGDALVPLEFYSPEAFGFLAYFGIPHLILARAALLFGLCWYLEAVRLGGWGWRTGAAWLGLAVLQPLALVAGAAALLVHAATLLRSGGQGLRRWLKAGGVALLFPAPVVLYLAAVYQRDPSLQAWARQNYLPSPPPWQYLVSFLPLLPLAGLGAWRLLRQSEGALLAAWPPALLALAYAPVGVQRRLIEGVWVGLAVLAAAGLEQATSLGAWKKHLGRGLIAVCLPTSMLLVVAGLRVGLNPSEPAFRPAAEVAAFAWLADHAPRGSVVLASFSTGNALPAWAPLRVVIGHGPETAGLAQLRPEVEAFFESAQPDTARTDFLKAQQVAFVFFGPHERALGAWDPGQAEYLQQVYAASGYAVYALP
jgi:hypothetical protein